MSNPLKELRKEIACLEFTLDRVKIEVDAVCEAMKLNDAEIKRLSSRVDELQEKCDYLGEVQGD